MRLYFLRHGLAADPGAWQGSDADRPLTDEGRERIGLEAKAIALLEPALDAIVTSPLVRARQTAGLVALRLGVPVTDDARLGHDFDRERLAQVVRENADAQALMLVGHEPTFSSTIAALIGGGAVTMKKGGLARVDLADASATRGVLVWLLTPKVLLALPR